MREFARTHASTEVPLGARIDRVSSTLLYVGWALAGGSASAAVWRICRLDQTSGLIQTWADGNAELDNIWDNRASLAYS